MALTSFFLFRRGSDGGGVVARDGVSCHFSVGQGGNESSGERGWVNTPNTVR